MRSVVECGAEQRRQGVGLKARHRPGLRRTRNTTRLQLSHASTARRVCLCVCLLARRHAVAGGGEGKGTCTKYDKIDADCKKLSQGQCNIKCSWLQSEGRCGRDPNYDPNSCKDRQGEAKCVPEKVRLP